MQEIDCPLCGSEDYEKVSLVRDRLMGINGQFTMVRCIQCGLHYLNPQPSTDELERHYPADYEPFQSLQLRESSWSKRFSIEYGLKKRCRAVTRYKKEGSLLEIGCANGLFLDAMRRAGRWQVEGVEVSESAVRQARELLALDVFHGTLEDTQFPSGHFDAVAMWDVLEHVHAPNETLREIHRILKPDGAFVLRVPQLESWDRKLFGPYWAGWDAPRHLTVFSRDTLRLMLAEAGLRVERMASISGSYPTFVLSVRLWAQEHLSAATQRRVRQILESLPARVLAAPAFYLTDKFGKSTTVTCVARPTSISNR